MFSCSAWLSGLGLRTWAHNGQAKASAMHVHASRAAPPVINAFGQRRPDTSEATKTTVLPAHVHRWFSPFHLLGNLNRASTYTDVSREEGTCIYVYNLISGRSYVTLENCSLETIRSNKRATEKLCRQLSEKRTTSYVRCRQTEPREKVAL